MDKSQISEKDIERGLFVARNRVQLRIAAILSVALLIGVMIIISASNYFSLISQAGQLNRLMSGLWNDGQDWQAYHKAQAPLDIEFGPVITLAHGNNKYDVVVEATNPNLDWALQSFAFQFINRGQTIAEPSYDFLLPGETRYIGLLGFESTDLLNNIEAVNRFDLHWAKLRQQVPEVWQFDNDPQYRARQIIQENGRTIQVPASVSWTVSNIYPETIRQPHWQVQLFASGKPILVISYEGLEDIDYSEQKTYEVAIFDSLTRVDQVEVVPILDIFQ